MCLFYWLNFYSKKANKLQTFQHLSSGLMHAFKPFYIQMNCIKLQKIAKL